MVLFIGRCHDRWVLWRLSHTTPMFYYNSAVHPLHLSACCAVTTPRLPPISCFARINQPHSLRNFPTIKTSSLDSTPAGAVHELLHLLFTPSIMIIVTSIDTYAAGEVEEQQGFPFISAAQLISLGICHFGHSSPSIPSNLTV